MSVDGTLTIDTSGLPLSIGNLQIEDTTIKTLEDNRDLYVVSNGTGNVSLIGEIHFYKPNGFPPTQEPFLEPKMTGRLESWFPLKILSREVLRLLVVLLEIIYPRGARAQCYS